ncbi:MAG: ATP-binding protein [Planctomycetota bacterium]
MPERTDKETGSKRAPGPNWALPAAICASAALVTVFQPWIATVSLIGLFWTVIAFRRERSRWAGELDRASDRLALLAGRLERDRLFRVILDGSGVPIVATDAEGRITAASKAASSTLGGGRELVGRRYDELFTEPELHAMERHARDGEPGRARIQLPIDGEIRSLIVSADPMRTGLATQPAATDGSIVTVRDVTELVRAGDLKADFAANASHELRTPIASIRGAVETLQGPARNDQAMLDRLTDIVAANAARLEALVSDLLDLSTIESGDTPPDLDDVDLPGLCAAQTEAFEPVCARRSLEIETEIDERCVTVLSDEGLLGLIVRNLVENATKFAREHTTVRIVAKPLKIPADPDNPPPPDASLGMGLRLIVRDRGVGIPLAHQQRIFERFYQVDRARTGGTSARGTGLGLAIVKHAARRLGGRVGVESIYQQGTSMIVELPGCVPSDQADRQTDQSGV